MVKSLIFVTSNSCLCPVLLSALSLDRVLFYSLAIFVYVCMWSFLLSSRIMYKRMVETKQIIPMSRKVHASSIISLLLWGIETNQTVVEPSLCCCGGRYF